MKPVKGKNQTNKVERTERMDKNSEILESKEREINLLQPNDLSNEENEQMKKESGKIRRPKSGKSL